MKDVDMAIPGNREENQRGIGMPDSIFRDNIGVVISVIGFLYGVLVGALGWISKRLSKLRDHDEDIRRLTEMQSETAQILACIKSDQASEARERREEDGKIYARIEANAVRYDQKVDEIKDSLHQVGLKVERAMAQRQP